MAQSYADPNKKCFGPSHNPDTPEGWKNYCDCMFLGARVHVQVLVDGRQMYVPGIDSENLTEAQSNELVKAAVARQLELTPGANIRYVETLEAVKTENWYRCTSLACAIPGPGDDYGRGGGGWGGCNNRFNNSVDPFNVGPAMLFAPWTDLGAAVRGIPKEGAGIGYTFGQLISIDLADYKPLRLWQIYFQNPALFTLQAAKAGMLFPPALPVALLMQSNYMAGAALLLPGAMAQAAAEGKDVIKNVFMPALLGTVDLSFFALKVFGSFVGFQYFSMAGAIVGKACKDQLNTGEIDRIGDPFTRSIILFLAKYGARLGDELQSAVNTGLNLDSAPHVISFIADMFEMMAEEFKNDAAAYKAMLLTAKGMRVAAIIAKGIQKGTPFFGILDEILFELFGFSLTQLQDTLLAGPAAVTRLFDRVKQLPGKSPPDMALEFIKAIERTINDFTKVLQDLEKAFGGVDKLVKQFEDAGAAFSESAKGVGETIHKAVAVAPAVAPDVAAGATTAQVLARTPPEVLAAMNVRNPGTSAIAASLTGGGVGFAVGGPVGGVLGLVAGYGLAHKPLRTSKMLAAKASAPLDTRERAASPIDDQIAKIQASTMRFMGHDSAVRDATSRAWFGNLRVVGAPAPALPSGERTATEQMQKAIDATTPALPAPRRNISVALPAAPPPPAPAHIQVPESALRAAQAQIYAEQAKAQEAEQRRQQLQLQAQAQAQQLQRERAEIEAAARAREAVMQAEVQAMRETQARAQAAAEAARVRGAPKPASGALPPPGPSYIYPDPPSPSSAPAPVSSERQMQVAAPRSMSWGPVALVGVAVVGLLAVKR